MAGKMNKKEIVTARVARGAYGSMPGYINDGVVERIIEPPEGGTFLKFIGCSYLFKGSVNENIVEVLEFPKRMLRNFIGAVSRHKIFLVFLLSKKIRIALGEYYLKNVYLSAFEKHLFLGESRYCISVRELWRVMSLFAGRVKNERTQNVLFKLRNIICMVLEFDIAYRFIAQDILPLINKQALRENPCQEIGRVFDVLYQRSVFRGEKVVRDERWRGIKRIVLLALKVGGLKKLVVDFLLELDLNKIRLDNADYYFCLLRDHYDFRGNSLKERLRQKRMIDRQKHHFIPSVKILRRA